MSRILISTVFFFVFVFIASLFPLALFAAGPNLIPNGSLETTDAAGLPTNWKKGGYGSNTRILSYPVAGYQSNKAVRTEITTYTSGDAKWYFTGVPVGGQTPLQYSDDFRSNVPSVITAQFKLANGTFQYLDLGKPVPSTDWKTFTTTFTTPTNTVSITIFHLIKGIGYLETDNYYLGNITTDPTTFDKGYVSINFDDGWLATYQNAFPILNTAGFKSDTFIVTERLAPNNFPGFVKANQVLAMQNTGHVIGAHTRTHSNLTLLSTAEARAQIEGSRADLLGIGATPVDYFAYPFGAYNPTIKQMVKDAGYLAGRSSDGGYNLRTQDRYALRRQSMVNTTSITDIKKYIDTALAEKTWVILLFHEVDSSGNAYAVTPALFQQAVDYLKQKSVTPITIKQGIQLMNQ